MSGLDEQIKLFCPRCRNTDLFFAAPDGLSRIEINNGKFHIHYYEKCPDVDRVIKNLLGYVKNPAWVWGCKSVTNEFCKNINHHNAVTTKMWMKLGEAFRKEFDEWT
jgi:hypothetical protein